MPQWAYKIPLLTVKTITFIFFKAGENEKKLASASKTIEQLTEIERRYENLEEIEKQKSSQLSALQKDKELFNMETEVLQILQIIVYL